MKSMLMCLSLLIHLWSAVSLSGFSERNAVARVLFGVFR